ncbi:MAG: glycoside hydrolase family 97 catalytic domain-containing protein [Chitinophagaceae bacterium]
MFRLLHLQFLLLLSPSLAFTQSSIKRVTSPNKTITVTVTTTLTPQGQAYYSVTHRSITVLKPSRLGLVMEDEDLGQDLQYLNASRVEKVKDSYELFAGKKGHISYVANKITLHFKTSSGKKFNIIFQVSDDGIAFRYHFPEKSASVKTITREHTSFHFDTAARAFLQPMQESKSGWEQTNPAYEEHYRQNIPVTQAAPSKAGWVYPALFNTKDLWLLITETAVDTDFCATRLQSPSTTGEYSIGFPDPREIKTGGGTLPKVTGPFYSPWRVIAIGSLKTIIESTLGTDLAKPAAGYDKSFIKPGKSSWSWIMSKDDSIVYTEQLRYIDFAARMNWQYCLVDAAWDRKIGYEKIASLANYAASKKVGLLLWYNSAGDWNTVKYTPKGKLLTHEDRMAEFSRLKEMGIKGIKVDFFGGDGQSVMQYYIDILNDAALYGLMVNFHGATLPRGWHRTYPNLLTAEAVRGFEMVTFNQPDADAQANHCAMLPFTRNAFDPMDFTPMNLYKIPTRVKRKTLPGFELATAILFYSGIQHFAESPEGMDHVPNYVQEFLKALPDRWEDVQFIDGYPGKFIVLARKAGDKWYLTGINSEATAKTIQLNLGAFQKKAGFFISDGNEPYSFKSENIQVSGSDYKEVMMKPFGGFVLVLK